jgi:16S rRNA (cytidine1402-2'-O)-methyltransferase
VHQLSKLFIIATPIGNMEDITLRALRILGEVDVLACEDTRVTRKILERHEISKPDRVLAYHEHNEQNAAKGLVKLLEEGLSVAICTDGGYPGVSDPGYRVVTEAIEAGIDIEVIPGASAVPTALLASGLSTSSFLFKGFPPRKSGQRVNFFNMESERPHTTIFVESPHRIGKTLKDALTAYGDRKAAVCFELTKKFERVDRGYLGELAERYADKKVKGEITLVIAGNNPKFYKAVASEDETCKE